MIDHVNALVFAVRDVEKCALFYRDKLGFSLDQLEQDEAYLTLGSRGGIVLALKSMDLVAEQISQDRIRPQQASVKTNHCVVFVTDLDAEYNDLLRKGVQFINPPKSQEGGWRTAHFEDPDGNLWEIAQRPSA
jgi:lactoylglutathione lyase